jgi:cell division control protein 6
MDADKLLDEVFSAINKSKIFKDRDKLSPDYVPLSLPFREKEIMKIATILAQALKGYKPNNIFMYGLTGTGKTAVLKLVTKRLDEKARELQVPVKTVYINCRQRDTNYRVLADILEALGERVPFTGLSIAELYRRMVKKIESMKSILVVALDEIDFIVKKHGDDLLYKLTRINSELQKASVSIIGITNDINFIDSLDPRIRSSLGEEEIIFPPYNAIQLKSILEERAKEAFYEGVLDQEVIPICAAIAAREHGDARKALDLLRVSGEIAEREGSSRVTIKHVQEARNELERDKVEELVSTLPLHAKIILASILSLTTQKDTATTGEIYSTYASKANKLGIEAVTPRRATDIISELDMLGLISARVVSRGRYGKTKVVKIIVNRDSLEKALREDALVREAL